MPPKKKNAGVEEDLGAMRAARFGRVKNTLTMGFVGLPNGMLGHCLSLDSCKASETCSTAQFSFLTSFPSVLLFSWKIYAYKSSRRSCSCRSC